MTAYYNEHDPFAAAWLRELIKMGQIAPGVVDERSIEDIQPSDLAGYTQCHFFAGIGVWSYALRRAGWPDDKPVWTGSCPCQPFSAAGKGDGFADERNLWPAWFHLITQCQPGIVFGEQVASKDGLDWLDLVQTDLERAGYACGAVDLCTAGVGAPHIRQRLFFVAEGMEYPELPPQSRQRLVGGETICEQKATRPTRNSMVDGLGTDTRDSGVLRGETIDPNTRGMADANGAGPQSGGETAKTSGFGDTAGATCGDAGSRPTGPTNGLWADADWLFCRDGKWRPVEPGTFPLVNGTPARVGRLRGYGNAINAEVAAAFIAAYIDAVVINR